MYDFAFDRRTLERELRPSDFLRVPNLIDPQVRDSLVDEAITQAASGFVSFDLVRSNLRGRDIFQCRHLHHELMLRKMSRNLSKLTQSRQSDRTNIIKSLRILLSEGHVTRVYKIDVKHFYPSVSRSFIISLFEGDKGFPPALLKVFKAFDGELKRLGIPGLPQGLGISATLAEYLMRSFDRAVRTQDQVYYYARFVDDIVVLSTGTEDPRQLKRVLQKKLPTGLEFNHAKTHYDDFDQPFAKRGNADIEGSVDFLGYEFRIYQNERNSDGKLERKVEVDISPKKVKRIKQRICLSALAFLEDRDFSLLRDRLLLLSGNYNMYDKNKNIRRKVGIYWSYREASPNESKALPDLDAFLRKMVLSRNGRICSRLSGRLTDKQKRLLLGISFSRSFNERSFRHFNMNRLERLVGCWKYE
jgi:hypothetical protein